MDPSTSSEDPYGQKGESTKLRRVSLQVLHELDILGLSSQGGRGMESPSHLPAIPKCLSSRSSHKATATLAAMAHATFLDHWGGQIVRWTAAACLQALSQLRPSIMWSLGVRDRLAQPGHPEVTGIPCRHKAQTTIGLLKTWLKPNLQTETILDHLQSVCITVHALQHRYSRSSPFSLAESS